MVSTSVTFIPLPFADVIHFLWGLAAEADEQDCTHH